MTSSRRPSSSSTVSSWRREMITKASSSPPGVSLAVAQAEQSTSSEQHITRRQSHMKRERAGHSPDDKPLDPNQSKDIHEGTVRRKRAKKLTSADSLRRITTIELERLALENGVKGTNRMSEMGSPSTAAITPPQLTPEVSRSNSVEYVPEPNSESEASGTSLPVEPFARPATATSSKSIVSTGSPSPPLMGTPPQPSQESFFRWFSFTSSKQLGPTSQVNGKDIASSEDRTDPLETISQPMEVEPGLEKPSTSANLSVIATEQSSSESAQSPSRLSEILRSPPLEVENPVADGITVDPSSLSTTAADQTMTNMRPGISPPAPRPSASRFIWGLPFLGASKVTYLEEPSQSRGIQDNLKPVDDSMDRTDQQATEIDSIERDFPEDHSSPSDLKSPSITEPGVSHTSWWSYLVTRTATNEEGSLAPPTEDPAPTVQVTLSDGAVEQSTPAKMVISEQTNHNIQEAIQGDAEASWLSPWGWYSWTYSSPNNQTIQPPDIEPINQEGDPTHTQDVVLTNEAPLAPEDVNPITTSISTYGRGWASLFSSKSLNTKRINDNESSGMEVMNLDDEIDDVPRFVVQPGTSPVSVTGDVETQSSRIDVSASSKPKRNIAKEISSKVEPDGGKSPLGSPLKRSASPAPSKNSTKSATPTAPRPPNLVLPTFKDTFFTPPRSRAPKVAANSTFRKTIGLVSSVIFSSGRADNQDQGKKHVHEDFGKELPRAFEAISRPRLQSTNSFKHVVVIGVHGWFPGVAVRTMLGEPTGTSTKFANMMYSAVEQFAQKEGIAFDSITKIPLEGEGKIVHRVERLYQNLVGKQEWLDAVHSADVIFVATHSQGCIVSTHLISRLLSDGHIRTSDSNGAMPPMGFGSPVGNLRPKKQRVCCLAMCGIHLGPLAYLHKNSIVQPYIQYFESAAAAELFEFQDTNSQVSKDYVQAIDHVLNHQVKIVYVASMNDQVVPIYSGIFTTASHPLLLRALYIDGDAYSSSDFLCNLLVLLFRIRNAGLSDGGLLSHLSEATAGSLNGIGHSTAYEEIAVYSLAVDYLFLVNDGSSDISNFHVDPFNARSALNDYEIPWALRDVIADDRVAHLFAEEFAQLRDAFDDWQPKTTVLRDLKRKLEPIRRLKLYTSRL